jgi:hypothetical protein
MRIKCENFREACATVLQQRLGLDRKFQAKHILLDESSVRLFEEVEYSHSYPGLKSVYRIHEVMAQFRDPDAAMGRLGLPEGTDFTFSRSSGVKGEEAVVTYFRWKPVQDLETKPKNSQFKRVLLDTPEEVSEEKEPDPKRRADAPKPLTCPARPSVKSGGLVIEQLMKDKKTDWNIAKRCAKRIRDPTYTTGQFLQDCVAAFPELALYVAVANNGEEQVTTSGRSSDDEFQRTIGALFGVFWLMRLDLDGARCFSFGVDDKWQALGEESKTPCRAKQERGRRQAFLDSVDWKLFEAVMKQAGLRSKSNGTMGHDEDRTLGMIVLTAIHDIMKVQALLPTVEAGKGPYCGYQVGEVINDHDTALGYVLEMHPDVLPSFAGLPQKQKDSVAFTQCNMEYNMGWLVQAEAPPGALFRKFKSMIVKGNASASDIAFYFTHWLTDLAGAEPYPLEGCEKFVLKFPQKVLVSFLSSFRFVELLDTKTETAVFESYLTWRWDQYPSPGLGDLPSGKGSIARMRLAIMTQGSETQVLEAYEQLPEKDRDVLASELARTGCQGQLYNTTRCLSRQGQPF